MAGVRHHMTTAPGRLFCCSRRREKHTVSPRERQATQSGRGDAEWAKFLPMPAGNCACRRVPRRQTHDRTTRVWRRHHGGGTATHVGSANSRGTRARLEYVRDLRAGRIASALGTIARRYVRFWHIADITSAPHMSALGVKRTWLSRIAKCPLMTQSGHQTC